MFLRQKNFSEAVETLKSFEKQDNKVFCQRQRKRQRQRKSQRKRQQKKQIQNLLRNKTNTIIYPENFEFPGGKIT